MIQFIQITTMSLLLQNISIVLLLEPDNALLLVGSVGVTDNTSSSLSSRDSGTVSTHDNVEVHTVNTDTWVVLDTQVDVLVNTETEVTGSREVSSLQLELLDSQTSLQDLLSLWASDGNVDSDLLVSSDTEGSDGVSSLRLNWGLTRQLLQDLGGSGQSVTGLTDTDVQDQFLDTQLTHRVLSGHDGLLLLEGFRSWAHFFFSEGIQCAHTDGIVLGTLWKPRYAQCAGNRAEALTDR